MKLGQQNITCGGDPNQVLEVNVYGEGQTDDTINNLRGAIYEVYDGAGLQTIPSYDFKGNPNSTIRQYVADYTQHPNWIDIGSVDMETDTYTTVV